MKKEKWSARRRRYALAPVFFLFPFSFLMAAEVDVSKLPPPAQRPVDFAADIKPIFEASCVRCHGTERPKSRFSLATRETALKGGENGIDILPGDSAKSPLVHYVARLVPDMEMPPDGKGDPLTRDQVALLRAWIDQGVPWEKVDPGAQYAAQFSFTPAVRWVTVNGNAQKFQEHQWVRRGFTEGVSDFRIAQKDSNGVSVLLQGHAMTEDYKITLDLRKEELGFMRFGIDQFRRYYDDHGPYYPFSPSGFATQTRTLFSLDRDLHLDVGHAFAEFGLDRPHLPKVVIGYEYHYKNGTESTEEWGPASQRNTGSVVSRHIYPAYESINEDVHVLRLDVSHEIAGTHLEDNLRAEFSDLKTKRVADSEFASGQVYPTQFTRTGNTHDQVQVANTLHGEKAINDWLFVSAGYLFSHFDADATVSQNVVDGARQTVPASVWAANDITLSEDTHVFNFNALGGPYDGFTAVFGLQNEWSRERGFGQPYLLQTDPNDPIGVPLLANSFETSDIDRVVLEESAVLRYNAIPATALFAEARWKQDQSGRAEAERVGESDHDFLRNSDFAVDWQQYKTGFEVSPWRWMSLNASYTHRLHDSDYDDDIDARLPRKTNQAYAAFINSGEGYPGFIRSRQTESDVFETRLVLRPLSWLKTTFSYQLALTDYEATTDPLHSATNAALVENAGGHVFAGEYDSATYSANITLTPWRRWYLSGTLSYQESRTWTAADETNAPIVVPYRGDTYSIAASSTFALSAQVDLTASYSFSRSRFAQHNAVAGLPLGIDYDLHNVQGGLTWRVNPNLTTNLRYGFFQYDEPTARGFNDYTAHMVFATVAIRLP